MTGPKAYLFLALAAVLGTAFVFARSTWLLLVAQSALAYVILYTDLQRADLGAGFRHMLFWALCVSIVTIQVTLHFPDAAGSTILRGEMYREEMFRYIETGIGAEGTPRLFLPQHGLHYSLTLVISTLSGGFGGLFLGAILLDYMNYYVGSLVRLGEVPSLGALVGWPIWSYVRVAGFIAGAITMAHLFFARFLRRTRWRPDAFRRFLYASVALFLLDIVLKWTLAPMWRQWLERALLGD